MHHHPGPASRPVWEDPMHRYYGTPEQRFWAQVDKNGPIPKEAHHLGRCWLWTGNINNHGYGYFRIKKKKIMIHRFSFELLYGLISPNKDIDHICHIQNCVNPTHMRVSTHAENMRNMAFHKNNTSGFKGVIWAANKWRAQIKLNGKNHYLGRFLDPEDAYRAYCEAAKQLHGEFANFGVVRAVPE